MFTYPLGRFRLKTFYLKRFVRRIAKSYVVFCGWCELCMVDDELVQ